MYIHTIRFFFVITFFLFSFRSLYYLDQIQLKNCFLATFQQKYNFAQFPNFQIFSNNRQYMLKRMCFCKFLIYLNRDLNKMEERKHHLDNSHDQKELLTEYFYIMCILKMYLKFQIQSRLYDADVKFTTINDQCPLLFNKNIINCLINGGIVY